MNYLCVCQYGHSRSVAMARVLHHNRVSAVACGWQTSPQGLVLLSGWADNILLLDRGYIEKIEPQFQWKCIDMHVGPDRWCNPFSPDLLNILAEMAKERLNIGNGAFT